MSIRSASPALQSSTRARIASTWSAWCNRVRHMLFELDLSIGRHLVDCGPRRRQRCRSIGAQSTSGPRALERKAVHPLRRAFRGLWRLPRPREVSVSVSPSGLGSVCVVLAADAGAKVGFWAPPGAAVANDGSLYLTSGNSSSTTSYDYGNSVVHLSADLRAPGFVRTHELGSTELKGTLTSAPLAPVCSRAIASSNRQERHRLPPQCRTPRRRSAANCTRPGSATMVAQFGGVAHDGNTSSCPARTASSKSP